MAATSDLHDEGILVRRMRRARILQWMIAAISVSAAAAGVTFLSPTAIGAFAYYTIAVLLLLNATIALRQSVHVLFPVETLLRKIRRIEADVDKGNLSTSHFSIHSDDAFACLTAGFDSLLAKLIERERVARERAALGDATLLAVPFTMFSVSRNGKVLAIIKDEYKLVADLSIEVGKRPPADVWGEPNAATLQKCIAASFSAEGFQWFDAHIGVHHLRGSVSRVNELTALVSLGDLPAIDKRVSEMAGASSECDFTHLQDALKHFAASVAHDGRNVFATLGNLVEVNKSSTDPAVREQVPVAVDAIERGTKLMTELMQYSGEAQYVLRTMSATEACNSILKSPTLGAMIPSNIRLVSEVSDKPMPDLDVDPDQLWRITFNLIKNSVEAIGLSAGRIWLKARPFTLSVEESRSFQAEKMPTKGPGVLFSVTDDGPGIDPMIANRLFDPYVSSKGHGRGLGLAKLMTVIDAHNGAVRVRTKRGHGTSFEIFIPASRHTESELEMIREIAPNGEILLVDDDPMILRTTKLVLQKLKIAAHPAASEEDAIRKIRTLGTRIHAVLIDAHLRGTTSANLIRKIRALYPKVSVILTSGSNEENIGNAFANVPYDCFIAKPYTLEELSKVLLKEK